jgi:saccharopine dehydrogenase-like NADP-dependent oxidoreductase
MKKHVLIIGAGGVAQVVAHKCAQNNDLLGDIHIASRTLSKCERIVASVRDRKALKSYGRLEAHELDALDVAATEALIRRTGAQIVINVGSAFVNMAVLSACIATGAAYIDTAIHEDPMKVCETPPWYANYEWKRREECAEAGVTAVLGAGFDPGVVNAYARLAQDEYFDRIDSIDIIDINAGSHGGISPRTSTRRSTFANSRGRCGRGRMGNGRPTGCSRWVRNGNSPSSAGRRHT